VFYDVRSAGGFSNQYAPGVGTVGAVPLPYCDSGFSDIHNGGSNVLFADGHGKWLSLTAALGDRTMWVR
jgi:prepilin-type processing-associated H-X9-DG protein